jgi:hypothetical protein
VKKDFSNEICVVPNGARNLGLVGNDLLCRSLTFSEDEVISNAAILECKLAMPLICIETNRSCLYELAGLMFTDRVLSIA